MKSVTTNHWYQTRRIRDHLGDAFEHQARMRYYSAVVSLREAVGATEKLLSQLRVILAEAEKEAGGES